MILENVTLEGIFVRLEPLSITHLEALCEVGLDDSLWKWTSNHCSTAADMERYVSTAIADRDRGISLPFVTIEKENRTVIGSTRFGSIDSQNRKVEIGYTWINSRWQRTAINTEAKLLMLTHAFEVWKCIRVELKTDVLNQRSRNAIARIGAKEEGTLRNHTICDSGRIRDTVYFSITEGEWPDVKQNLIDSIR
ncbi:MAG: GNAT family protein [Pyrinomonadaceae bacterium]